MSLLDRLDAGDVIIGDGGMVSILEKRCYVKAGVYTPECVIEFPDAVRQLHREFLRAGADVLQTMTFSSSDDKLRIKGIEYTCNEINNAACKIAKEVAAECDRPIMVAGSISETCCHSNKSAAQALVEAQLEILIDNEVDFLIVEYYCTCDEICWAIEVLKKAKKPIVAMMNIGGKGDRNNVSTGECAVRMAEAGADVIGLNCCFDPMQLVEAMKEVKTALEAAGFKKHLICQPLGFWTPDAGKDGYIGLPEYPFALEPRQVTRFEMQKFAREAYNAGIRYIGGCCFLEAYHIRAIAEELSPERGFLPPGSDKNEPWGGAMRRHPTPWQAARCTREYWENLVPATGRIYSPTMSKSQFKEM